MHCHNCITKNAIYKVCTIFKLHTVYQNHQLELPYKQSANLQIAHAIALPAGSAKIRKRAKRFNCAQVFPDSFSNTSEDTTCRRSERRIFDIIFSLFFFILEENNLKQSYLHINHQHLLCTSCEFLIVCKNTGFGVSEYIFVIPEVGVFIRAIALNYNKIKHRYRTEESYIHNLG